MQGVNVSDFLSAVKGRKLDEEELNIWVGKLTDTFSAQRQLLIPTLMGVYCDPESSETTRINALKICFAVKNIRRSSGVCYENTDSG